MANSNFFVKNGLSVNNATTIAGANGQISVGSNLVVNTSTVFIGNSTVNTIANSSTLAIGSVTHNSSVIAVGSNVTVNTTTVFIGNSTVNTSVNSSVVYSGSYNTASDRRLKKNIKKSPAGITNLDPKQFVYRSDPSRLRYGFIAQDVQKHFPELVTENSDGKLSLNYNDIIALLVQEIKDLTDRVNKIESANV